MKKIEKMIHQIIRFRGKIEAFLVSIEEFSSPRKHSYEGHRWCGVSIRGMRGMCAMLDVSQIRLWFESCENTRMRVAGGAGWVYAVCGVCALCWMCHTTFQIISTQPLSTFFHFNTNSTHTHTQPSSIIYHLLKLHSFLVFRLSFHFIILLYR